MFLKPIAPSTTELTDRQKAIAGTWNGPGEDLYAEGNQNLMKMEMRFEFGLNHRQIIGPIRVTPVPLANFEPVSLSFNGEFYNDDLFELVYRSRVRKQYGVMLVRISEDGERLDGHYAGFSPTRKGFVMGTFTLTR
jgi:hypothetical protein